MVYVRVVGDGVYSLGDDDLKALVGVIREGLRRGLRDAVEGAVDFVKRRGAPLDPVSALSVKVDYVLVSDPRVLRLLVELAGVGVGSPDSRSSTS